MGRLAMLATLLLCACGQQQGSNRQGAASAGPDRSARLSGPATSAGLVPDFPGSTPVEIPNLGAPGTDTRSGNTTARQTPATPDQVAQFYRDHFLQAGIPVRADTSTGQGRLMSVGRDGEVGAMITISPIGDATRIAVTMARGR
jgi:hypothetical protein